MAYGILRLVPPLVLCLATVAPAAPGLPTLRAGAGGPWPASIGGEATPYTIDSALLGETRTVHVVTPHSWASTSRPYPLLVVLDGAPLLPSVATAAAFLAEAGAMPEVVLAAVDNTDRTRDLTPPGLSVSGSGLDAGGDRFLDFLERELLPEMSGRFRAGAPCILVGHSSGGILGTYVAATRDVFPFVLALDTPTRLGDAWLPRRMMERAAAAAPAAVHYASIEARFGWDDDAWASLVAAAPPAWTLHRERLPEESHQTMVLLGSYLGLRALFAEYSSVNATPSVDSLARYESLTARYGAALPPPDRLLASLFEDALIARDVDGARTLLERRIAAYGEPTDGADLRRRLEGVAALPPATETVASMRAEAPPTPERMAPYLGEWTGETWRDGAPHEPVRVRFFVEDGKVTGEWRVTPAPGHELVMVLEYLHVGEGTLDFGYMNGMRPRGFLVYEARAHDDILEGTMRLRGVDFTPPPGVILPRIHFRLSRA